MIFFLALACVSIGVLIGHLHVVGRLTNLERMAHPRIDGLAMADDVIAAHRRVDDLAKRCDGFALKRGRKPGEAIPPGAVDGDAS